MTTMEAHAFDIYIRFTDANGHAVVREHRVWDGSRFMTTRAQEARRENTKAGSDKASVQQITREQFHRERK